MAKKTITPAALSALAKGDAENFVAAMTPGGIEAQEHHGQMKFAASSTLPKHMLHGCTREKLTSMGIVFGDDADDLFVNATLPHGWRIRPTLHSMWSDLVDERGRCRAKMFYKAAFYDRDAHISLTRRYTIEGYQSVDAAGEPTGESSRPTHYRTVVKDGEQVIHVVGVRKEDDRDRRTRDYDEAKAWLTDKYPDWENECAYWV